MAEQIKELQIPLTLVQKLKHIFMGKKRPGLIIRVFFWASFILSWFYFFIWYLMSYISLISMHSMLSTKPEATVKAYFTKIGLDYNIEDALNTYQLYCIIQLFILLATLLGLFFIWRKWKLGGLILALSHATMIGTTIFILSWTFFVEEVTWFDKILQLSTIGAGIILFIYFNERNKKIKLKEEMALTK